MKRFKSHINIIKTNLALLSLILLVVAFRLVGPSKASFQDVETTTSTFTSGSVDLAVESLTTPTPLPISKGENASFSVLIANVGTLDFGYFQKYDTAAGDLDLCQALNIRVVYNWYDNVGTLHQSEKYDGLLTDFSVNELATDVEMMIDISQSGCLQYSLAE